MLDTKLISNSFRSFEGLTGLHGTTIIYHPSTIIPLLQIRCLQLPRHLHFNILRLAIA
jgi:hypothetical protein